MKYIALLRGISPSDPRMSGAHLRAVCESLGFTNVQTILGSGNVVFETGTTNQQKLESLLEDSWRTQLGFTSMTIVKTHDELQQLVEYDPFHGMTHNGSSYLMATFLKHPVSPRFSVPYQPEGKPYKITGFYKNVLFSITDNTVVKTTDLMGWLEKEFGKDITSRTWNTVQKIYKKQV